jgi:hypothetical protein
MPDDKTDTKSPVHFSVRPSDEAYRVALSEYTVSEYHLLSDGEVWRPLPYAHAQVVVHRDPGDWCLPTLKRQIEDSLADVDPWDNQCVWVVIKMERVLEEDEAVALPHVLNILQGPAEGWRLLHKASAITNSIRRYTDSKKYSFTLVYRCAQFKDLVNG